MLVSESFDRDAIIFESTPLGENFEALPTMASMSCLLPEKAADRMADSKTAISRKLVLRCRKDLIRKNTPAEKIVELRRFIARLDALEQYMSNNSFSIFYPFSVFG
jgi:hypothetical protein